MSEPGTAAERLVGDLKAAWEVARGIEPARGQVSQEQVTRVRAALEKIEMARATLDAHEDADALKASFATVYARSAVVAIAAGSESNAARWLANAEGLSKDDEQLAELRAARKTHERYRALVHGRNLIANRRESEARKVWTALAKEQVKGVEPEALIKAAITELKAPRPLQPHDKMPTLARYNGVGAGFYGRRDRWPDGSYATTHCFSVLYVPLFPFSAWRVRDAQRGYTILAKEQLSGFARAMRLVIPLLIVAGIAGSAINAHLNDPHRLAGIRFDDALAAAKSSEREAALRQLDSELEHDAYLVDGDRAAQAGAEIVRLSASPVTRPFTADKLDQAARLARRYHALPDPAQRGVAQAAMLATLDGWTTDLGDQLDAADARLALLGYAADVAPAERKRDLAEQMTTTRIAVAAAKQDAWPLDALAILVQEPGDLAVQQADKIVARLVDAPSLLLDAGADFDAWKAATKSHDLRDQATAARDLATAARDEVEAEGVTPKQLAAMAAKRPWDQRVALQLARNDAGAGKLEAAAARLVKLGAPGLTIRDARFTLAQIRTAQGKLDEADAILTTLLDARLPQFVAASAAFHDATQALQDRLKTTLRNGDIPLELQRKLEAASEDQQRELIHAWVNDQMTHDAPSNAAREKYQALSDIVPVSLAAGSVKLRRAQALGGAARSAMLEDAEKMFLAIRTEAEDQPEFQLGLGEIYARLGKTKESDAAFETVLALKNPKLSLDVATVYRQIGSIERAKQVAKDVLAQGDGETKDAAALMLGIMAEGDDDEAERWYKLADAKSPAVKIALLDLEGKRLLRQGKPAECAAKFEAVAKANLANAGDQRTTGYNNAAVAHEHRYECNGDPQALRDAEAALENAYRGQPDDPIVVGNLASVLDYNGRLRVLGKRLDVRALRLDGNEVVTVINKLLDSAERDAVLAELAADPGVRRGDELLAQYEVLAPNSPSPYEQRFGRLADHRDVDGAAALVERARHAKALDTSEAVAMRDKVRSGAFDARYLDQTESQRARLAQALALPTLDPKSRAVALYLSARNEGALGLFNGDAATIAHARASAVKAMQLWPTLDTNPTIIGTLLDQAGVEADAKAWLDLRRGRGGSASLAKLTADGSPLAAKMRATKPWAEIAAYAQADHTRPDVEALRLARLLADPALETRAKAVLDDRLEHLRLELALVMLPGDEPTTDDLATLDKR